MLRVGWGGTRDFANAGASVLPLPRNEGSNGESNGNMNMETSKKAHFYRGSLGDCLE